MTPPGRDPARAAVRDAPLPGRHAAGAQKTSHVSKCGCSTKGRTGNSSPYTAGPNEGSIPNGKIHGPQARLTFTWPAVSTRNSVIPVAQYDPVITSGATHQRNPDQVYESSMEAICRLCGDCRCIQQSGMTRWSGERSADPACKNARSLGDLDWVAVSAPQPGLAIARPTPRSLNPNPRDALTPEARCGFWGKRSSMLMH